MCMASFSSGAQGTFQEWSHPVFRPAPMRWDWGRQHSLWQHLQAFLACLRTSIAPPPHALQYSGEWSQPRGYHNFFYLCLLFRRGIIIWILVAMMLTCMCQALGEALTLFHLILQAILWSRYWYYPQGFSTQNNSQSLCSGLQVPVSSLISWCPISALDWLHIWEMRIG